MTRFAAGSDDCPQRSFVGRTRLTAGHRGAPERSPATDDAAEGRPIAAGEAHRSRPPKPPDRPSAHPSRLTVLRLQTRDLARWPARACRHLRSALPARAESARSKFVTTSTGLLRRSTATYRKWRDTSG